MGTSNKRLILIFSGLALLAVVILSTGISRLDLQAGQRYALFQERRPLNPNLLEELVGPNLRGLIFMVLYIMGYVLLPLSIVLFILKPELRKGFGRYLGPLVWLLALYYLIFNLPQQIELDQFTIPDVDFNEDGLGDAANVVLGSAPGWMVYITSFMLLLIVASFGLFFYLRFFRTSPLLEIAQEAQHALQDLQEGADLSDTIKRCYVEMSRSLNSTLGIKRNAAMTPREFERRLGTFGLPQEHVQQLTRLFEQVRYGDKPPSQMQEEQAIHCLSAIVLHTQTII